MITKAPRRAVRSRLTSGKQMRDILILIQVATGVTAGVFFAAALEVFGDGGMLASLLYHFDPITYFGISIALFVISYALWFAGSQTIDATLKRNHADTVES